MSGKALSVPRPFLKWAGGKTQLLDDLRRRFAKAGGRGRYYEPFVGGGAFFFDLCRRRMLGRKKAYLSDNNGRLIEAYHGIRDDLEKLIEILHEHQQAHGHEYYYDVRAQVPGDPLERAARIIYLNKTCYNGLFRENSKGLFNVPIGRYKDPTICDEPNLRAVAEVLKKARVEQCHFSKVLDHAEPGDFVYFDPPYHPLSKTSSFTGYHEGHFGEEEQRELAGVYRELTRRSICAMLSNSMTEFVCDLYRGLGLKRIRIEKVYASRSLNSRADRRGKVSEALVVNF